MKTTFYELIEKHGKLDDTYVDLIKNADGSVTFIVQTDAEKPVNGVYYYKITGKAQFSGTKNTMVSPIARCGT